jgi:2-dehydro-3-deoxyphosphooctonate aldolase (KDO 8-P synthase)
MKTVTISNITVGPGTPLLLIAGPCVIEEEGLTLEIAARLRDLTRRLSVPFIFKASYDKANRTAIDSFRGPGLAGGLAILEKVRSTVGVPVISDVHRVAEVASAASVLDILQVPAFLCRQTDFLLAVAGAGRPVNIKKGQFLAPWDMAQVARKLTSAGNREILFTERGAAFGYNNLVADMRSIPIMREIGWPVIFDATHSVQLPGGAGTASGGQRQFAPVLARAAVAAGADGVFLEVHPDPDQARCDGPNTIRLDDLEDLLPRLLAIRRAIS